MNKKKYYIIYAIERLYPNLVGGYIDKTEEFSWSNLKFENGNLSDLDQAAIEAELENVYSEMAYQQLRQQRNQLLQQSDWMANSDVTMSDAWRTYRQALRDLPANSPNVALDEQGNLINVTWPTKPE